MSERRVQVLNGNVPVRRLSGLLMTTGVYTDPEGTPWVMMYYEYHAGTNVFLIDPEEADQLPDAIKQATEACRRARMNVPDIIIPEDGHGAPGI